MLPQQLHVDAGPAVEALQKALGNQIAQVAVAGLVPAEQHQMGVLAVHPVDLVEAGSGGHVDLAADDGLDPRGFGGLVEVDDAVHNPVVCDGHGRLPQLLHPLHQLPDPAGAVEEAVLGM